MTLRKNRSLALILIIALLLLIGLTGCGSSNLKTQANGSPNSSDSNASAASAAPATPTAPPSTTASNGTATRSVEVTLYFPTPDASGLAAVKRSIDVSNGEIIKAMFDALHNPPSGLEQPLPKGTKLLSATVKDGVATLNLSKEFKTNFGGGAAGEQMILYSIVNTLTTLPEVQRVQFLLDGEKSVAILGEIDTSSPLKRNESLIRK